MHEFRVWAPAAKRMRVAYKGAALEMQKAEPKGWWALRVEEDACGADYAYLVDEEQAYPDPRSLWQPDGVHGASRVYDHSRFAWTDAAWKGTPFAEAVVYELHVGTFSPEGTFDGAMAHLDYLVELGITHVEVMPVAAFPGDRGWGYDGVALFAVQACYGGPDGLKRFVDACHAKGLSVVLDVVYNHFGPVGNYVTKFAPYLTDHYHTPWGQAVNLDQPERDQVRRFFADNALMWLRDYHCDGLRLDAVHEYIDRSAIHFMEQLSIEVDELEAQVGRPLTLIAESDLNDSQVVRPREENGYGIEAQWSDDFHHALFSMLYSDESGSGYYRDYGSLDNLVKALRQVFVFDGQYSHYRLKSHGRPAGDVPAQRFLGYIQNHDQVGNRALGERMEHLAGADTTKLALGLVLMAPFVPMLFMGEEFAASSPFLYFADHEDEGMARLVSEGRKREFAAFGFSDAEIPNPEERSTFERSRLIWDEVHHGSHADMLEWTKALIHLRRTTPSLNDGDLKHLQVESDSEKGWLWMRRGEVRVVANVSKENGLSIALEDGEEIALKSQDGCVVEGKELKLPVRTLVVLRRVG